MADKKGYRVYLIHPINMGSEVINYIDCVNFGQLANLQDIIYMKNKNGEDIAYLGWANISCILPFNTIPSHLRPNT